jgi:hypothetical protein
MTGIEKLLSKESSAESIAAKAALIAAKISDEDHACTRQVIEHWIREGRVPGKWAPRVNRVYRIPLHELNPSIYPKSAA